MRRFYQTYQIQQTVSAKLTWSHYCELLIISDPDRRSFNAFHVNSDAPLFFVRLLPSCF